jgi:transposase
MRNPEDVSEITRLHGLGLGTRRIAEELNISRNTVRNYLRRGGWDGYRQPKRENALAGQEDWLREKIRRHRGNADVVRQELAKEKGLDLSLRTVERAVRVYRIELEAEAKATVRFETPPGRQLQIDFGQVSNVRIGEGFATIHLFVATLGYSRRRYVAAFHAENQSNWFEGLERCFRHFGGIPEEVLIDNPRALVDHHDRLTREVDLNEKFKALATYWGFRPVACAPYRARTKGKTERSVGYVKGNCIAGRSFATFEDLESHIEAWVRDIADKRIHETTREAPIVRFERDERSALKALDGRPPFHQVRELHRRVHGDATVEIDTNRYSVPWQLAGQIVRCRITNGEILIHSLPDLREIARHAEHPGRHACTIDRRHLAGIVRAALPPSGKAEEEPAKDVVSWPEGELQRPLSEYQALVEGLFPCGAVS